MQNDDIQEGGTKTQQSVTDNEKSQHAVCLLYDWGKDMSMKFLPCSAQQLASNHASELSLEQT